MSPDNEDSAAAGGDPSEDAALPTVDEPVRSDIRERGRAAMAVALVTLVANVLSAAMRTKRVRMAGVRCLTAGMAEDTEERVFFGGDGQRETESR